MGSIKAISKPMLVGICPDQQSQHLCSTPQLTRQSYWFTKSCRLVSLNGAPLSNAKQIIDYLAQHPSIALLTVARSTGVTNYQIKF
jgi:hypothetical protein